MTTRSPRLRTQNPRPMGPVAYAIHRPRPLSATPSTSPIEVNGVADRSALVSLASPTGVRFGSMAQVTGPTLAEIAPKDRPTGDRPPRPDNQAVCEPDRPPTRQAQKRSAPAPARDLAPELALHPDDTRAVGDGVSQRAFGPGWSVLLLTEPTCAQAHPPPTAPARHRLSTTTSARPREPRRLARRRTPRPPRQCPSTTTSARPREPRPAAALERRRHVPSSNRESP
jgi:hypothetical protein